MAASPPRQASTAYERYLQTDQLLSLQRDPDGLVHPDEMIFLVVQQSSELWLKLLVRELEAAEALVAAEATLSAIRHLRRAHSYMGTLTGQLDVPDYISPWSYQQIRTQLEDGSGFSSPGWSSTRRVARRLGDEFFALLDRRGAGLREIYVNHTRFEDLYQLAEGLVDLDVDCMLWRTRHLKVIERTIGSETSGLAGTPIEALAKLTPQRFYPALWQLRSQLTDEADRRLASPGQGRLEEQACE
ncbi:tryptophan 2,3-dioxygenase family protein [Saccharothrix yanglingensis]|uniref:Tryptophan 2,3-dioxygenase n=1 Tax=Saccharothrix yanglingensis TaxID=659496 RepID=A0ABU0X8D8_9PSEU|nr:tryptophan 2,3-dioxygenase family protein [Saccharothrix yanglingensis]MDQ2587973.1 tryptophan 2,3-dioxygenase [Saccharothrix yanglingensis]